MHIDSYDFGEIVINGKSYDHDVIIYKDKVDENWRRIDGHRLTLGDIIHVLAEKPEILVVGTGKMGVMDVPQKVISDIESKGIKVIVKKTGEAVEEFNKLIPEKRVIAALHLTC